jgi:Ca2+-binding RTX toxin-like protein
MMKTSDFALRILALLSALAFGCASPVAPEDPNGGGSGNADGRGGSGNGSGSGATGGRPSNPVDTVPGVDEPLDVPPEGCLNAATEGAISLSLDAEVPSVSLEATDGVLFANGVACTDTGGADVALTSVTSLAIASTGSEANAVIFELGSGDWSALLEVPEAIQLEFSGGGISAFILRGTANGDRYRHGMRESNLVFDLVGDGRINVVAAGVSDIAVELGAGDDELDDLTEVAAERANAEAAEAGEGEETTIVPVTPLTLPVVVKGGEGNDWLLGGSGPDDFDGGPGDDVMSGLGGDDLMYSAEMDGADLFNGGLGYDYVSYEERINNLSVALCISESEVACPESSCSCGTTMSGEDGEDDRLINVDDVTAGSGDDTMHGSIAADSLSGGPGDDQIFGEGGSDLLYGQSGDDVLNGGPDGDYCGATGADQAIGCEL